MADTVTSQTIQDGERVAVLKFTNVSDGTGESAVKKVDVSALNANKAGESCTSVSIARIYWACVGMRVNIEFDATSNVLAMPLPADSSGVTGDIDFTTVGHSSGDAYSIILVLNKNY
jgi:hypothetical protein